VVSTQRDRILDAFAHAVGTKGYPAVTVSEVIERAGVSSKTFYELFRDKQACFLAAYEAGYALLSERIGAVHEAFPGPSTARARAVLGALLDLLAREPDFARLSMEEVYAAGPEAIARHTQVLDGFVPMLAVLDDATRESRGQPAPEPVVLDALVGGIASVIHRRIVEGRAETLPSLLDPLTTFLLAPFVADHRPG
jgi:AcrR family transcriptional regulator